MTVARDLHSSEFDETTESKLELFRLYLREWLPVFLAAKSSGRPVNIFDFFAGPGRSPTGQPGSPQLIVEELRPYYGAARRRGVRLFFNEKNRKKLAALRSFLEPMTSTAPVTAQFAALDFADAFRRWQPEMAGAANLLFLDQSGVRHITNAIFNALLRLECTDFLFFIASSTFHRFGEHPSLRKYFKTEKINPDSYTGVHRAVQSYYKAMVPSEMEYYLPGYSLKKGSNIYGLIFGTHHPLGAMKFLRKTWSLDEQRGEANFDIDDDRIEKERPFLFEAMNRPTKLAIFEADLRTAILTEQLVTDRDVSLFALENGCLGKHARDVAMKMKAEGLLKGKNLAFSETCLKPGREPVRLILTAGGRDK